MGEHIVYYLSQQHEDFLFLAKYYRKRAVDDDNPIYAQVADDILDRLEREANRHG